MYLVQFCHYQRKPENAFLPKTKIPDPRFAQMSCGKSWIWEHPAQTKIQDPRFAQKSCGKSWIWEHPLSLYQSKILARSLVGILDLGSWFIQDFSQESCGNLGSWILVYPRF